MTALGLFSLLGCHAQPKGKEEVISSHVQVRRGTLEGKVSWRGFVRSANRVEIRSDRRIKISRILTRNAATVKRGELLIQVDRTEAQTKQRDLNDKVQSLQLDLNAAGVKFHHAEKVKGRKSSLLAKGIIARREYDDAIREYKLSENDLKAKQLELDKANRDLKQMETDLKSSDYYSPMNGVVSGLIAVDNPGSDINPGQLLGVVSDPSTLAMVVQVEEANLFRVSVGLDVKVTLDSFPGQGFSGKVLEVSHNSVSSQTSLFNNFEVTVGFNPNGTVMREGLSGEVMLTYFKKENALSVPLFALRYLDGKDFVMASNTEQGDGSPKSVKVGTRTDNEAEILSGVAENEFVIVEKK